MNNFMRQKWEDKRLRYLIVGGVNTVFGFSLFTGLYLLLQNIAHYIFIFALTQSIAISFSHYTQRRFVWHSSETYINELGKFATVYITASGANVVLLIIAVEFLELSTLLSQYVIGFILILSTYFSQKLWVFQKPI